MSKTLKTLIRYKKQTVDEQRRRLAQLAAQKQRLEDVIRAMGEELKREIELASTQVEMGGFFGNFAGRIRARQEELGLEIKKLDVQMEALAEKIRESFAEMKRFEILLERRLAEAKALREKQEAEQLDEVAILRHAREDDR